MAVGDGRNQVLPDTIIATDWGNAIADRTCQSYATVAERDAQWVAPQPGAMAYTAAEDEFWTYWGGRWKLLPFGYMGGANGPSATTTAHGTYLTLATYNFTAKNGRVYQLCGHATGSQATKGGSGSSRLMISDSFGVQHYGVYNDPNVGDAFGFDLIQLVRASSSGAAWVKLSAACSVSGGGVSFSVNSATVWVVDVGG